MEKIFNSPWIEIEKDGNKFFLIYDSGQIASKLVRLEVTEEDAQLAQKSEDDAYRVILKYQNKKFGYT